MDVTLWEIPALAIVNELRSRAALRHRGRIPVDVKEGDLVIFSKYGGTEVKYNGEEFLVLPARDVLAVVEK